MYKNCPLAFLRGGNFFCYSEDRNGVIYLTIEEYIKNNPKFYLMPYMTIYTTITELIKDGFIKENSFFKSGDFNVENA